MKNTIHLSKRLKTLADFVTKGSVVADIGCDHAHIPIYLIQNNISDKVIAMDINIGPLNRALENVKYYGYENKIELRLSDGAKELKPLEADTILIAGMGGILMTKILNDSQEVIIKSKELLLQPQSDLAFVRKSIRQLGFFISKEEMIIEDNKYYFIIKALKGIDNCENELYDLYGKYLLETKNQILKIYLLNKLEKFSNILNTLKKNSSESANNAIVQFENNIHYIKEGLKFYDL